MLMILLVGSIIGLRFTIISPVLGSLWSPLFQLADYIPPTFKYIFLYTILILLLVLEIYYLILLNRHKKDLASGLLQENSMGNL